MTMCMSYRMPRHVRQCWPQAWNMNGSQLRSSEFAHGELLLNSATEHAELGYWREDYAK